jgi:hypothetical protein
MKNEYGLQCPVNWESIGSHYQWVAIDADGELWAFTSSPKINNILEQWAPTSVVYQYMFNVNPPADFTQCLWKRPK